MRNPRTSGFEVNLIEMRTNKTEKRPKGGGRGSDGHFYRRKTQP